MAAARPPSTAGEPPRHRPDSAARHRATAAATCGSFATRKPYVSAWLT